jgi:integrase
LAAFLDWEEKHTKKSTYEWHRNYLQGFVAALQDKQLLVSKLKKFHVTRWLDAHASWGVNSRRAAITSLKRAFNWAVDEGYIAHSPVAKLRKPKAKHRETILSADQCQLILDESASDFFDFVALLLETGVRPGEVRTVEARHVNTEQGLWVFPPAEHKTGRKTSKPRIVYLSANALEITKRLVERHPTGPLLRNSRGKAWTKNAVRCRFRRLRRRLADKLPPDLCAYLFRHTFATRALEHGLDSVTVAELMGHADATMVSRVYQHVGQRLDHMRAAAERATAKSRSVS